MEFHALSNIFPLMEGVAFRDLVEDIRVHGLREPIMVYEGAILDGRNRWRACQAAQVSARFTSYAGKDAVAFVVSANLHRRHLDASQRALIAAEIAEIRLGHKGAHKGGRRDRGGRLLPPLKCPERPHKARSAHPEPTPVPKMSAEAAGSLLNVSSTSVRDAQRILQTGVPGLVSAVRSGEIAVQPAKEIARLPKLQQEKLLGAADVRSIAVIGRQTRVERLEDRRVRRAAADVTDKAVYDHFKIRDGRPIGNVRFGELRGLIEAARRDADVLAAIAGHVANASHGDRIRDILSQKQLSELIASVVGVNGWETA